MQYPVQRTNRARATLSTENLVPFPSYLNDGTGVRRTSLIAESLRKPSATSYEFVFGHFMALETTADSAAEASDSSDSPMLSPQPAVIAVKGKLLFHYRRVENSIRIRRCSRIRSYASLYRDWPD